jgi:hypothetical protein
MNPAGRVRCNIVPIAKGYDCVSHTLFLICNRGQRGVSALRRANEHSRVDPLGEAVSSRMAGAPAQEEIDEPADKFLRPRSDIAHLELLA